MVHLGKYNKLKVMEREPQGFYLEGDEEWGDILLPNKYVPAGLKTGDEIEVFIYFDSEDIIIATTLKPLATIGEFANLKVKAVEEFGIFLDWGLEKDLFVPFSEQTFTMTLDQSYVVYIYLDSSDRIAASTRIHRFIDKSQGNYTVGETVELLPYQKTEFGMRAVINGQHAGLIFKDETHLLLLGEKVQGFIKEIRDDGKINLSLNSSTAKTRDELADLILERLRESGGQLQIDAKTSSEEIHSMFEVSRKKFKVALGHLYKQKIIEICDSGIRLVSK